MSDETTKKKRRFIDEAATTALAQVKLCEERIAALHLACAGMRARTMRASDSTAEREFLALHMELHRDLLEAHRTLFMWAILERGKPVEEEARRIALGKYLRHGVAIMDYLRLDTMPHGGTLAADEEEFRAELAAMRKTIAAERAAGNG